MVIVTHARRSPSAGPSIKVNGPALRFVRQAFGLSLADVADAAGISVGFLARVERGEKHGVRRETFERIAYRLAPVDPRVLMVNPYVIETTDTDTERTSATVLPFGSNTGTAA